MKTHQSSFIKLLTCAALACVTACVLRAQDAPSRRVTGQEKAVGAEVRINQIETSEFPKVTIFATVLKDGLPVQGLGAGDFRMISTRTR